jgi:hypothetical protein
MIAITGMLQSDGADGYMLVDKASGDSITLKKKAKKLGELEGKNVTLTGRWYKNDETTKTFKVVKVAETPAESPASATHAEQPAAPTALSIPEDTTAPQQPAAPQEQPTPQEQLEPDTAPVHRNPVSARDRRSLMARRAGELPSFARPFTAPLVVRQRRWRAPGP